MKNLSTWILVMFMAMFWILRVIVALTSELKIDFGGIVPTDMTTEVILLFVVLGCLVFVIKRKTIGGIIYLFSYGLYFGKLIYDDIMTGISASNALNIFVSFIGIILALAVLIDLLVDRNRKTNPADKKTDWYYKNEEYDRKLDDRSDKNNYRTM